MGPIAVVGALREEQVLAGQRVMDLGSGMVPGFALAAKALGAEVCTVDGRQLDPRVRAMVDDHVAIDLSEFHVPDKILEQAQGQFDHVSECIIGYVPEAQEFEYPGIGTIVRIGDAMLRLGGLLHMTLPSMLPVVLQK